MLHVHLQGQQNAWWKEKEAAETCHSDWTSDSGPGWLTQMGCNTRQLPNTRGTTVNCHRKIENEHAAVKSVNVIETGRRKTGPWVAGIPLIRCIRLWKVFPPSCIPGLGIHTLHIGKKQIAFFVQPDLKIFEKPRVGWKKPLVVGMLKQNIKRSAASSSRSHYWAFCGFKHTIINLFPFCYRCNATSKKVVPKKRVL